MSYVYQKLHHNSHKFRLRILYSDFDVFYFGLNNAVFNYIAKDKKAYDYFGLYLLFICIQVTFLLLITAGIYLFKLERFFFNDNIWSIIGLAGLYEFSLFLFTAFLSFGDASGLTQKFQKVNFVSLLLRFTLFLGLYYLGFLTMLNFLAVQLTLVIFCNGYLLRYLKSYNQQLTIFSWKHFSQFKQILVYSLPLLHLDIFSFFANICDTYLIQFYLGSSSQAIYSFSLRVLTSSVLIVQPVMNLFWKYVSENIKDHPETVFKFFLKILNLVLWSSSVVFLVLAVFSEDIFLRIVGEKYIEAYKLIQIVSFSVVPICLEKIATALSYGSGETKIYRNIVISLQSVSMLGSFLSLLLASKYLPREKLVDLLLVKYMCASLLITSVLLMLSCKFLKKKPQQMFLHMLPIFCMAIGSWGVYFLFGKIWFSCAFALFALYGIFLMKDFKKSLLTFEKNQ